MRGGSGAQLAGLAMIGVVVLVMSLLLFLPSGAEGLPKSAFSTADDGRKAVYLLLDELGFEPRAWRDAPGRLPRDGSLLFLSEEPEAPPGQPPTGERVDESEDLPTPPLTVDSGRRLRDLRHYRDFVEEGGTLVVPEALLGFVADVVEVEDARELAWHPSDELSLDDQVVLLADGSEASVPWGVRGSFDPLPLGARFEVVFADADQRAVVVRARVGDGAVVLLPSDRFLDNDRIEDGDAALFCVRLVEALDPAGSVVFDEYALGGWVPETPLELAFAPGTAGVTTHALAFALLALWALAWVRAFPRDPEPLQTLAPRTRAEAQAGLLVAAGRFDVAASQLVRGVLRRLAARTRLARELDEEGHVIDAACVESALAPLSSLARNDAERARWRAALLPRAVRSAEDLAQLDAELRALERRVLAGDDSRRPPKR